MIARMSVVTASTATWYTDWQKKRYRLFFANGSNRNVEMWYLLYLNKWIIATMLFASSIIVVYDALCDNVICLNNI